MSLIANVDPLPSRLGGSFIEKSTANLPFDESTVPFSGIQIRPGFNPSTTKKRLPVGVSFRVAKKVHHHVVLGEKSDPTLGGITPDVLMCFLPAGKNGLSARVCDMAVGANAVPFEVLACSQRLNPQTVSDLLIGSQVSPVDFTGGSLSSQLRQMPTSMGAAVTLNHCNSPRTNLPDTNLNTDYLVFVLLNPSVESKAENYVLANSSGASGSVRAGLVFVATSKLQGPSSAAFRSELATKFLNNVAQCNADGICSASELVDWTPKGDQMTDSFVGTPNAFVKVIG